MSVDPLQRAIAWVEGLPEADKVVAAAFRTRAHSKTPGVLHVKERTGKGLRLVGYSAIGLRDVFVYSQKPEALQRRLEEHFGTAEAPHSPTAMEAAFARMPVVAPPVAPVQAKKGNGGVPGAVATPVKAKATVPVAPAPAPAPAVAPKEDPRVLGARVSHSVEYTVVEVTPEVAMTWLITSPGNRKLIKARILHYADLMRKGKWRVGVETIKFSPDPKDPAQQVLADGHNRLEAVIESGVTVRMDVVFNVPPDAREFMDTGKIRTVDDTYRMTRADTEVSKATVAVANWLRGAAVSGGAASRATFEEVSPWIDLYRDGIHFVLGLKKGFKGYTAGLAAVLTRAYYNNVPKERIERFVTVMRLGIPEGPHESGPVLLRNWIQQHAGGLNSGPLQRALYHKTERALLAFLNGEVLTRLYSETEERYPLMPPAGV